MSAATTASASPLIMTTGLAGLQTAAAVGVPAWLAARRAGAARWVDRHGFPTRRHEDWRYLDLSSLLALPFDTDDNNLDGLGETDLASMLKVDLGGPRLVFVNGRMTPRLCRPASRPDELGVGSMATALVEHPHELETSFAPRPAGWYHAFDALNAALAVDGAFLRIPAGTRLEAPVQLVFLALPGTTPRLASPRSVILAGTGSRVSLVVHHLGVPGPPVCTNAVVQVSCSEGAQVDYTEIQDAPETAYHLSLLDVHQGADSRFSARTVTLGGLVARHELRVALAGRGADASLDGLYLPAGHQHHDYPVLGDHVAPGATSRQLYKGVVSGHGHGVFNGHIVVRPGADGTDAAQINKSLLLSDQAEMDTRPRLEIHADDVRCAHGAAVGQLDADALYYLRSRGIPRGDAERILVTAFVGEMVDRIPHGPVRAHIQARVAERFSAGEETD